MMSESGNYILETFAFGCSCYCSFEAVRSRLHYHQRNCLEKINLVKIKVNAK